MAKYKCSEPSCKNKVKYDNEGFCPECGAKLRKTSNLLPIIGIGALLLIGLLVVGALTVPTGNITTNDSNVNTAGNSNTPVSNTPKVYTSGIVENKFVKFELPKNITKLSIDPNGESHYNTVEPLWKVEDYSTDTVCNITIYQRDWNDKKISEIKSVTLDKATFNKMRSSYELLDHGDVSGKKAYFGQDKEDNFTLYVLTSTVGSNYNFILFTSGPDYNEEHLAIKKTLTVK